MDPAVIAFVLLGVMALLVLAVTVTWLLGGLDGTAASRRRLERMTQLRDQALARAHGRGHQVVGPSIDAWLYSCTRPDCLGTVGVILDGRGRPLGAGTAVEHDCPTLVETPWEAPTHHRHSGPAHDH